MCATETEAQTQTHTHSHVPQKKHTHTQTNHHHHDSNDIWNFITSIPFGSQFLAISLKHMLKCMWGSSSSPTESIYHSSTFRLAYYYFRYSGISVVQDLCSGISDEWCLCFGQTLFERFYHIQQWSARYVFIFTCEYIALIDTVAVSVVGFFILQTFWLCA